MRRIGRKGRQRSLLAWLRGIRVYPEVVDQILRDLKPLIVALLVGAGLIFDVGGSLRQLVSLLAK